MRSSEQKEVDGVKVVSWRFEIEVEVEVELCGIALLLMWRELKGSTREEGEDSEADMMGDTQSR